MDIHIEWVYRLSVALALGLLVGIERGWQQRGTDDGQSVAGLRTFGLVGLLGGLAGVLGESFGILVVGLIFIGLSLLVAAIYVVSSRTLSDLGMTSEVAMLATFLLAAMAGLGYLAISSAGAVIMTLLLSYKSLLHGWLEALKRHELIAGIKLLLISVVLLPLLPNEGFGPWQALNPYAIWWMVVLISLISFSGYFAIRIAGARAGIIFTALFGGLASSTALTLSFSRLARRPAAAAPLLAGGILLACGTMFPRMLLVASLINPALFDYLLWPAVSMAAVTYAAAFWLTREPRKTPDAGELLPKNPLELTPALSFGVLLAVVMLLARALGEWFGDTGIYALAATSGIADVDAITLSLARLSQSEVALTVAGPAIVLAAAANSLLKGAVALIIGGKQTGLRVAIPLLAATVIGLTVALIHG